MSEEFKQYTKDVNGDVPIWKNENQIKFDEKINDIIEKTMKQGQLIITGVKQTGKTNSAMWILRKIMEKEEYERNLIKTLVLDLPMVWRYKYDELPYVDVTEVRHLPIIRGLIVDLPFVDSNKTRSVISRIMMNDFVLKRKLKDKFEGRNPYYNLYFIEETQNCFGTYALSGTEGRFFLKIASECANYGMILVGIGQRLADISTRIVERTRYFLFGATSGDNDLRKLKRMGSQKLVEGVEGLKRGQFTFYDKDEDHAFQIDFPKFVQKSKPYRYTDEQNGNGHVTQIF